MDNKAETPGCETTILLRFVRFRKSATGDERNLTNEIIDALKQYGYEVGIAPSYYEDDDRKNPVIRLWKTPTDRNGQ